MKRIIGIGKPRAAPPTINDTISTVDRKSEDVKTKIAQLDAELIKLKEQMNRLRRGSPAYTSLLSKATRVLQRKKQYETLDGNLQQQSYTMEMSTASIQSATMNQQIVTAMKTAVRKIERANKKMNLDEIDDLQEKMEDVLEISNDIQGALARNYAVPDMDDDELEAELNEIALDDDKSYLDEATRDQAQISSSTEKPESDGTDDKLPIRTTAEGIQVDEFGLPIVENHDPHT